MEPVNQNAFSSYFRPSRRGSWGGGLIAFIFILALVVFLFGLGRLMAYRMLVCQRYERQYELSKIIGAKSAVRRAPYLQPNVADPYLLVTVTNQLVAYFGETKTAYTVITEPVPPVLWEGFGSGQQPSDLSGSGWVLAKSSDLLTITTRFDGTNCALVFECAYSTNANSERLRAAIARQITPSFTEKPYGLLYQIRPIYTKGLHKLKIILIGYPNPEVPLTPSTLFPYAESNAVVCVETEKATGTNAIRTLRLLPQGFAGIQTNSAAPLSQENDFLTHMAGLYASKGGCRSFGSSATYQYILGNSLPFSSEDLDHFRNVWLIIEHEFSPDTPSNASSDDRRVTLDFIWVKEPQTYNIYVYNTSLEQKLGISFEPQPVTAILRMGYGVSDASVLLDTMGTEPANMVLERRGIMPTR